MFVSMQRVFLLLCNFGIFLLSYPFRIFTSVYFNLGFLPLQYLTSVSLDHSCHYIYAPVKSCIILCVFIIFPQSGSFLSNTRPLNQMLLFFSSPKMYETLYPSLLFCIALSTSIFSFLQAYSAMSCAESYNFRKAVFSFSCSEILF